MTRILNNENDIETDEVRIVKNIEKILVTRSSMPPFEEYVEKIKALWDTHWLTNMGAFHVELEEKLKDFLRVPYVSLMVNGHMALEMAIQAFDFPRGSEVITTPFTFISTTHAIVRNGLKPVFCDVHEENGTIDESKIDELITENTVAIIPVHVYGNPCNVDKIQRIADKYQLKVIYDAAHAFGVEYMGKGIASYGDASVFSFHATKVFNTIEGGAVAFSDPKLYEKLYNLKNFGIQGEELVVDIGANAKMNEFAAAMGLCNLQHFEAAITARKQVWNQYKSDMSDMTGLHILEVFGDVKQNYAYFPVVVEDGFGVTRDELHNCLLQKNIVTRKYFYPLTSDQACFKNKYKELNLQYARKLANQVLCLPIYEELELESVHNIVDAIKQQY